MPFFFCLQFFAFFFSILVLNHWINQLLLKRSWFDSQALPVFAWGWFVYFVIYQVGRWQTVPVEFIRTLFTGIAFGVAIAGGVYWTLKPTFSFWRQRKRDLPLDTWTISLILLFIAVMIYIGPYLEHPSDSVEYFARIQAWEKARFMNYPSLRTNTTFSTFYEHWLLQYSGFSYGERWGISGLSALTQGVLLWELIRIAKLVTGDIALSGLAGLMSLGYFGYTAISFYRYAVFSGSMFAYLIYLEALILIITLFMKEQWRYLLLLPPLLWLCWNNHEQETLLQLTAIAGIGVTLVIFRYRTLKPQFRNILVVAIVLGIFAAILFCLRNKPINANLNLDYQNLYIFNLATVFGKNIYVLRYIPISHIMGIVGWLSILLALGFLLFGKESRKMDIMASLTLFHLLVFCNPLAIQVLRRIMIVELFHRLTYGSLYWMFLVFFLHHFSDQIEQFTLKFLPVKNILEKTKEITLYPLSCFCISVLLLVSLYPYDPVFGKMIHVFLKVPKNLDGSDLKPVLRYVRDNAEQQCIDPDPNDNFYPIRHYVLSDPYVNTYLQGTGYFYTATFRWDDSQGYESNPLGITTKTATSLDYSEFIGLLRARQVCYVIIYLPQKQTTSWLGKTSNPWPDTYAHTQRHYSPKFLKWVRESPQDFELVFEQDAMQIFQVKNPEEN